MDRLTKIRDIQRAVINFEHSFERFYGICLNEGMALRLLTDHIRLTSGEISEILGLTPSNTSKVIASIEKKGYVKRIPGKSDKRQMYFTLSNEGKRFINSVDCDAVDTPDLLNRIVDPINL